MSSQIIGMIILFVIGLFVLYLVVYAAVKDGINKSVIGQYYEKKLDKRSVPGDDLDK